MKTPLTLSSLRLMTGWGTAEQLAAMFSNKKVRRNRSCAGCNADIPPGREGRKCKVCREAEDAWNQFAKEHMVPSRLFRIAMNMIEPTTMETEHLEKCEQCRTWMIAYRESE